jgi:ArsR family transcriptional regulator
LAGVGIEQRLEKLSKGGVRGGPGVRTGDLLPLLSRKAKRVIGVDNSPGMLEEARKLHRLDEGPSEPSVGDLHHLPLRDGEVDCAVMTMVCTTSPSPRRSS